MKISFLGFGEAASSIALGLSQEGCTELCGYDVLLKNEEKKERTLGLMKKSETVPVYSPMEAAKGAKVIFTAVPANFSVSTAESVAEYLEADCIYTDVTTASPEEKKKIAALVEDHGAKFVDGAMLGPLLQYLHKVPMLLSGSGCEELVRCMEPYHMNMSIVNDVPGTATSIKFIRSITAKGLACLLYESLQAAQYFHVEDMIVSSLCESYGEGFEKVIDGYISGTSIHAARREHEMQNVVDMLKEADLPYEMSETTRQKLAKIADIKVYEKFEDGVPRNWRGVLAGWGLNDQE